MEEIWRPVVGFEGKYEVSSIGNVRSLDYHNSGFVKSLIPRKDRSGYLRVMLFRDDGRHSKTIHSLVARAFLGPPRIKARFITVNHRNENKLDNRVSNLEYLSSAQNTRYGSAIHRSARNRRKAIIAIDKSGRSILFRSLSDAAKATNSPIAGISQVLKHKRSTSGGYKWFYAK